MGLSIIDRDSHIKGLILRPLSAKLLQETIPEQKGWVDRDKLYNFSGRVRGPQFDLAQKWELLIIQLQPVDVFSPIRFLLEGSMTCLSMMN